MSATIEIGGKKYKVTLEEVKSEKIAEKKLESYRFNPMAVSEETIATGEVNQTGGKKAKKVKGGTRKSNPYMNFAKKARQELLVTNPELKSDIPGMGKAIGAKWRALSEAEKAKY